MTLVENVALLNEDLETFRLLCRELFCSEFVDGNVDESGMAAFRAANNMMIHMSETMTQEATLLTEINNKLDKLLEKKD